MCDSEQSDQSCLVFIFTNVNFNITEMNHKHENGILPTRKPCVLGWNLTWLVGHLIVFFFFFSSLKNTEVIIQLLLPDMST